MRILIVVGLAWHAPDVARAFEALGDTTLTLTAQPAAFTTPVRRVPCRTLLRLSGRFPLLAPIVHRLFSWIAAEFVRTSDFDAVLIWSSFGASFVRHPGPPVMVIRGSNHIRTQFEMLKPAPGKQRRPSLGIIRLEEFEYERATLITVPTQEIESDLKWPSGKMVQSPYGFGEPGIPANQIAKAPDGALRAVFVGEISYRKGADRLLFIDSTSLVRAIDIVGGGKPAGLQLPSKAVVHGQIAREKVDEIMGEAHVLILLSREEGMARVGMEALAHGLPILVTPESGLAQWCVGGAGIVLQGDSTMNQQEDAIREIAANWEGMANQARLISTSWSWIDHAKRLRSALQDVEN